MGKGRLSRLDRVVAEGQARFSLMARQDEGGFSGGTTGLCSLSAEKTGYGTEGTAPAPNAGAGMLVRAARGLYGVSLVEDGRILVGRFGGSFGGGEGMTIRG